MPRVPEVGHAKELLTAQWPCVPSIGQMVQRWSFYMSEKILGWDDKSPNKKPKSNIDFYQIHVICRNMYIIWLIHQFVWN